MVLNEQILFGVFALLIGAFTAWDLFIDSGLGTSINHIVLEGTIVIFSFVAFIRIILLTIAKYRLIQDSLNTKLVNAQTEAILLREDNIKYRNEAQVFLEGIAVVIDRQFSEWKLTNSEKEVALLMLKGLSNKQIAEIRNTSEKTIQSQASQIYSKSSLESRAQLSAYFLEDLLLP
jgi:DNA-binding NarL/FixJ family response regulator